MSGSVIVSKSIRTAKSAISRGLVVATILMIPMMPQAHSQPGYQEQDKAPDPDKIAAENFVRADLEKGLNILNDRSVSEAARLAQLQAYLDTFMDIRRVALFSLGMARQYATPAQIDQFVDAFRSYIIANYGSMLVRNYTGQVLRVTGSTQTGENSYLVTTMLVPPTEGARYLTEAARHRGQSIEVDLRVVNQGGQFIVTDVALGGMWLAIHERDQMNDYFTNTNGNVGGLIVRLKAMTNRAGSATPTLPQNVPATESP